MLTQSEKVYLYNLCLEHNFIEFKEFYLSKNNEYYDFTLNNGNTLLHAVSMRITKDSLSFTKFLLDIGGDQFAVNQDFLTPFDIAKQNFNAPALALFQFYKSRNDSKIMEIISSK